MTKKTAKPKSEGVSKKKSDDVSFDWAHFILRASFGFFILFMGLPKLTALFAGSNPLGVLFVPIWLAWILAIIEVLGGAFLVIGIFSRFSSLLIAFIMAGAIVWLSVLKGFNPVVFFQHLLYLGAALVIMHANNFFITAEHHWKNKKH